MAYTGIWWLVGSVSTTPIEGSILACKAELAALIFFQGTSFLIEMHISLGFAFVQLRSRRGLKRLNACLVFVWPFCLAMGAVDAYFDVTYIRNVEYCVFEDLEFLLVGPLAFCMLVSLTAYLLTVVSAQISGVPHGMQLKQWRRALGYPLTCLVSYGPLTVQLLLGPGKKNVGTVDVILFAMLGLNGFLNALVYAYNTRYVSTSVAMSRPARQREPTLWSPSESRQSLEQSVREDRADDIFGIASFHVAFCTHPSIYMFWSEAIGGDEVQQNNGGVDMLNASVHSSPGHRMGCEATPTSEGPRASHMDACGARLAPRSRQVSSADVLQELEPPVAS
eukprot:NODE_12425_length_1225_cov_4.998179.p1 GENE.NODE_12425_length_1225_cov_4.998179~~NODE_12425_length_1225_cov_4.998179.p1  ORF type:complete len:393 (+),score=64.59 NODE_12425_length_1225_cov_4.998179:173-1180(+)